MTFSIIIVNYRTEEYTRDCLNSIFNNCDQNNFEIILIDNDSRDGSIEKLEKEFNGKIKIIKNKENLGFGKANNQGAKIAKGEFLFFLNSDTLIKKNILDKINLRFQDSDVGILSPSLILENGDFQENAFGTFPSLFKLIFRSAGNKYDGNKSKYEVGWVSGAAMIIRNNIFKEVNSFDENLFMYFEDVDLCKRVRDLGYKIFILPNVEVVHFGGKSEMENKERKVYYYKSQDYYFKKHFKYPIIIFVKIARRFFLIFNKNL